MASRAYPAGFFSDDESDGRTSDGTSSEFEVRNPMYGNYNNKSMNRPAGPSLTEVELEKTVEEEKQDMFYGNSQQVQHQQPLALTKLAGGRQIIQSLPTGFFASSLRKSKAKSKKNVWGDSERKEDEDFEANDRDSSSSSTPPPLPPSMKIGPTSSEEKKTDADDILAMLERSASHKSMHQANQQPAQDDDFLARFETPQRGAPSAHEASEKPTVVIGVVSTFRRSDIPTNGGGFVNDRRPSAANRQQSMQANNFNHTETNNQDDFFNQFTSSKVPTGGQAPTNNDDFLAQFENPTNKNKSTTHQSPQPELPPRKTDKAPGDPTSLHTAPELPPRRLKKNESSQSIQADQKQQFRHSESIQTANAADGEATTTKAKPPRRKTSFLEMLLREKQERGEFDPSNYRENEPILAPEEERETGMSKQEIQEKIRRIAQASATGHNTSGMGVGLRDIGFAVAKSRAEEDGTKRINVKSIAKHAEEMIVRSSQSNASIPDYGLPTPRSRNPSTSSTTSVNGTRAHPQQQRVMNQFFDPIGEVSEGAYSVGDSNTSFANRKPTLLDQPTKSSKLQAKNFKSKTDKFFGSMRLSFNQATAATKAKAKSSKLRERFQEFVETAKEVVGRIKDKAVEKSTEIRMKAKAAYEKRRNSRQAF